MDFSAEWAGITLADSSAGDVINTPRINGVPVAQIAPGLRAAAVKVFNRRNITTTVSFQNKRQPFASPMLCAQWMADHAIAFAAIATNDDLAFSIGDKDYELHDAVVTRREVVDLFGTTVVYAYEITGGELEDVTTP